jgi:hypothetical protein
MKMEVTCFFSASMLNRSGKGLFLQWTIPLYTTVVIGPV